MPNDFNFYDRSQVKNSYQTVICAIIRLSLFLLIFLGVEFQLHYD
jgi:hypothetical protein